MRKLKLVWGICFLLAMSVCVAGCAEEAHSSTSQPPTNQSGILSIYFTAKYSLAVGYGNVYHCQLDQKNAEVAGMKEFSLVFVVGAEEEKLIKQEENKVFFGVFQRHEENAPYRINPVTGFTDEHRTIWKLLELH